MSASRKEKNKKYEELQKLRHSAAHLLAHAISELYPDTLLTLGPPTKDGFFYDCLPTTNFKLEDLPKIEERMHEIAKRSLAMGHKQVPKDEARQIYKNNKYKLELIDGIPGDVAGIASQGDFYDLCRGGHVATTGDIKHFKLTGISGSYWRADKKNDALQRISGTAYLSQEDEQEAEERKAELDMYDHRRIGKQLDYFSFHKEGAGFPFFHPKGKVILNQLRNYMRSVLNDADYKEIETPIMLSDELWKNSGHYEFYKDNMYFSDIDEKNYAIKPMNCPGSILIYKERPRSYRELPLRLMEFGKVHRHELSGVLHGLFRVRAFTIDDTHIYCTIDQIEQEIATNIGIITKVMKKFGLDNIRVVLSTKPAKAMGTDEMWETAINALKSALKKAGLEYEVAEGDGAFYGPKIGFEFVDSMDREWGCGTIQLDFFQPENFDLKYVSSEGTQKRPVMLHQAIYGSLERFFGAILEHYKGHLPFWLSPVQARILTISNEQKPEAINLTQLLKSHNIRVELDKSSDALASQIKNAQLDKVPWMIILGKKEVENKTATIRYSNGKQDMGLTYDELISKANKLISE
ncbi:MAG: threonyl-tRNA synthetase [Alteromonas naphthalenivorans]|jgi:threonyl-tRNA synthetase